MKYRPLFMSNDKGGRKTHLTPTNDRLFPVCKRSLSWFDVGEEILDLRAYVEADPDNVLCLTCRKIIEKSLNTTV